MEFSSSNCVTTATTSPNSCSNEKESFDIVLIAAPQTVDKTPIDLKGFDNTVNIAFPGHYHRTVATLVHGELNPSYVGCSNAECTTEAYFFVDPNHNINSVAKLVRTKTFNHEKHF